MTEPRWLAGCPEGRDLGRDELRCLAEAVVCERESWEHLVRYETRERHYVQLHRDPHVDVWLLCWTDDQDTGLHDHDRSSGAVHVCNGTLLEDRLELREGKLTRVTTERAQGATFDFDASLVHCVRHPGGPAPAVSIHVYSPALWRMGYYDVGEDGVLRRVPVSYADELAAA